MGGVEPVERCMRLAATGSPLRRLSRREGGVLVLERGLAARRQVAARHRTTGARLWPQPIKDGSMGVFLADALDNGAGYCNELGEPCTFGRLLSTVRDSSAPVELDNGGGPCRSGSRASGSLGLRGETRSTGKRARSCPALPGAVVAVSRLRPPVPVEPDFESAESWSWRTRPAAWWRSIPARPGCLELPLLLRDEAVPDSPHPRHPVICAAVGCLAMRCLGESVRSDPERCASRRLLPT